MSGPMKCQRCGGEIPRGGLAGHCPRCLVSRVLDDDEPAAGSGVAVALRRFGDYELIGEIARGGMGVVYRARQVSLNRMVALKMILGGEFATPDSVRRLRNEAEAAARLRHPNIVTIHEVGEHDGQHYFAMELVEGPNFAALVRDGPMPARRAAGYLKAVAEAVQHAHAQRVLHRDLKPSNILLDPFDQPKVTDFGLARQLDRGGELTMSGQTFGSPGYMPPEQAGGRSGKVTEASDLYAMGAVLYHLLTGRPPFQGGSVHAVLRQVEVDEPVALRRLNPSVPADLETICLKCLDKDPACRYRTAAELAEELGRFLCDEPIQARPLGRAARLGRWMRRHPAVAGLGASVLVLLLVVAGGTAVSVWRVAAARHSEQQQREKAEEANRNLIVANDRLAGTVRVLELQRAEELFRSGDPSAGVAQLTAILRRDPTNHRAAERLLSALAHRDWLLPAAPSIAEFQPMERVRFSPDGRLLLAVGRDAHAKVYDTATARLVGSVSHADRLTGGGWSPDGRLVVTSSVDGTARIWNATNGQAVTPPLVHQGRVNGAEFSPDGRRVLTASGDRLGRIWDATTGVVLRTLPGHTTPVLSARFSPNGRQVATSGGYGSVRIWDADTGAFQFRCENRRARLTALEFGPDGRRLLWAGENGGARLWDLTSGQPIGEALSHASPAETVWGGAFSPDGKRVVTIGQDGFVRIWSADDGRLLGERQAHEGGIGTVMFSPEGGRWVTSSTDNSARVWDLSRNSALGQPLREVERMLDAAFSPDGRRVATASFNSVVQLWDVRPRRDAGELVDPAGSMSVQFSPDGETLATITRGREVRLLDARPARGGQRPAVAATAVQVADFSPGGDWLATGTTNGSVQLWSVATGRLQAQAGPGTETNRASGHRALVRSLQFSPDGSILVTGSADGTARFWSVPSLQPVGSNLVHRGEILMVRFSPDGTRVATAAEDWSARVWDVRSGAPATEPLAHIDHVKSVDFSPDGTRLVTGSTDNTACIWSVATGRALTPRLRHARIVERALFSPDGRRVATASLDRTVRIWDAATGLALSEPLIHDSAVSRLAWSPEGQRLVSVSWNGAARMWDADTGLPLTEWWSVGGTLQSLALDAAGRRIATAGRDVRVRDWPVLPVPVPIWFLDFAETVAGARVTGRGHLEMAPRSPLAGLIQPGDGAYERFARWFVADPEERRPGAWTESTLR